MYWAKYPSDQEILKNETIDCILVIFLNGIQINT